MMGTSQAQETEIEREKRVLYRCRVADITICNSDRSSESYKRKRKFWHYVFGLNPGVTLTSEEFLTSKWNVEAIQFSSTCRRALQLPSVFVLVVAWPHAIIYQQPQVHNCGTDVRVRIFLSKADRALGSRTRQNSHRTKKARIGALSVRCSNSEIMHVLCAPRPMTAPVASYMSFQSCTLAKMTRMKGALFIAQLRFLLYLKCITKNRLRHCN